MVLAVFYDRTVPQSEGVPVLRTIAIVDDELEMEDVFMLIFEDQIRAGQVALEFFADAPSFLRWTAAATPDLVITDICLPAADGPALVAELRRTAPTVPVYFMSGHAEAEYRAPMRTHNVSRYLPKPFNLATLLGYVERDLDLALVDREEELPRSS